MFHVMMALPVIGTLAVLGTVILWLLFMLLQGAFWVTLLLAMFCRKRRWLVWLPALFGVAGCVICVLFGLLLEPELALAYWGFYGLLCLIGWGAGTLIRRIVRWAVK